MIGAVLAETAALAEQAAKVVTVRYEELPAVMTIEDAIVADRFEHTLLLHPIFRPQEYFLLLV